MAENNINTEYVYPRGVGRVSFNINIMTITEIIINSIKKNIPIVYHNIENSIDVERMKKICGVK